MNVKKIITRLEQLSQPAIGKELGEIPVGEVPTEDADIVFRGSLLTIRQVGLPYLEKHVAEWFALGTLAHQLTWYTIAERYYRMVTAIAPTHADAWYHLGVLLDDQGLWQMAREVFATGLEVAPESWVRRAAVYKRLKIVDTVNPRLPRATSPANLVQSKINAQSPIPSGCVTLPAPQKSLPGTTKSHCNRCGRPLQGLPYVCRYCGFNFCVDHRLPESHLCTGSFRVASTPTVSLPASLPEVIPSLERLVSIASDKAWVDVDTDEITEGDERLLDRAAELVAVHLAGQSSFDGTFDLWFNAGKVAQQLKLASKAVTFYKAALALPTARGGNAPSNSSDAARAQVLAFLGQTLMHQHKTVEAENAFRSARALATGEVEKWIALGNEGASAWGSGSGQTYLNYHPHFAFVIRHPEDIYQDRVSHDPGDVEALCALAHFRWVENLIGEAERYFRAGLKLQPDASSMWNSLGCLLMEGGKLQPAEDAFRSAIDLDPQCPDSHYNLGLLFEANHRDDAAITEFRLCTKLISSDARLWVHLGMLLRRAGRNEEADGAFRHATRLEPWLETELPRILDYLAYSRRYSDPGNLYL